MKELEVAKTTLTLDPEVIKMALEKLAADTGEDNLSALIRRLLRLYVAGKVKI